MNLDLQNVGVYLTGGVLLAVALLRQLTPWGRAAFTVLALAAVAVVFR